jgi:site-specific DNA recombinase
MTTAKNVTVIPATFNPRTRRPIQQVSRRRVAGYARVSTDSDEQFTSYEAQVDYYTKFISDNPEWQFVKVYTDEGVSGLNTKKRDGFNEMIDDALAGKIDLIVTKSVSRFARNTVDSLSTIRKLRDKGVECYFEKEQIFTFDGKGELLLTIMASLAQEESRSISENVTWGRRKQFSDGKVSLPYSQFLGYRKGPDSLPEIIPEEAETVREIYRLFIGGKSTSFIAKYLTQKGIPSPGGKSKWQIHTVESILTNEKYKGAALLQKAFTVDFLTKKMKPNEGEVPQYFVADSHPAIIEPEEWGKVQTEMQRRKTDTRRHSCQSPFSGKIICGDCGEYFGSKVWHSTDQYRRVIWQCNGKFKGEEKCRTPHLTEEQIKESFVIALSTLLENRESLLEDGRVVKAELSDCSEIDAKIDRVIQESDVVAGLIKKCIEDNSSRALDQESYTKQYDGLVERYEALKNKHAGYMRDRKDRQFKEDVLSGFLFEITELYCLGIAFDESHWNRTIDHVTVYSDARLVFSFQNGREITVEI